MKPLEYSRVKCYNGISVRLRMNSVTIIYQEYFCVIAGNYISSNVVKKYQNSYTRKMYSKFEEEFTKQFSLSCKLLHNEGSILTFMVMPMESNHEATAVYNTVDMTITCSCRKYESIGMYTHFISRYNF